MRPQQQDRAVHWLAHLSQGWQGKNWDQFCGCIPACSSELAEECCLSAWGWALYLWISESHWGWALYLWISQNQWGFQDLWYHRVQPLLLKQGHPEQVARDASPQVLSGLPRVETPQLLWATVCRAWAELQSKSFFLCSDLIARSAICALCLLSCQQALLRRARLPLLHSLPSGVHR